MDEQHSPLDRPTFSLIVPTRQRIDRLRRFLDSLAYTAKDPARLEVVLVVDDDDGPSQAVRHDRIPSKHVVVARGATMGELNRAGYAAATGNLIMLTNDDVIARTKHWDAIVARRIQRFPDQVALFHVNDSLFGEGLCTFPLMSRRVYEAIDICPAAYRRYCIDDHIEQIFHMLAVLGHWRTVYLPDVVFEHQNFDRDAAGQRRYILDRQILAQDQTEFARRFKECKQAARDLRKRISGHDWPGPDALEAISDSESLRACFNEVRLARQRARAGRSLYHRFRDGLAERGLSGLAGAVWRRLAATQPTP